MRFFKFVFFLGALIGICLYVPAEDGMWMPHQMTGLNLKAFGLKMNPDDLYKKDGTGLMSAVVSLGGGTGEFVSRDGLILTNHHVAFGALQRASSEEKDYIENGFIAWSKAEEIPASGYIADVLLGYEDVTERVLSAIHGQMTVLQRYEALDRKNKELIAEAEKSGKDIRATVAVMYSGNKYYLFKYKRIKDIRLVYAPPQDLGNYGGDIDNWMWPRHTCDFSFLRAYVSRDNEGVDYSQNNVPYTPKSILKISLDGYEEGDFSFVMGYPGRTYRNQTLSELESDIDFMQKRMELYQNIISFLEKAGGKSRDVQIKYASKIKGLNNSLKNYQGKIEGMHKIDLIGKKKLAEEQFLEWVNEAAERKNRFAASLSQIDAFMDKESRHRAKTNLLDHLVSSYIGSTLLSQGYTIYRTVEERQKPDMEREPAYQERNLSYIKQGVQLADRGYDLATDEAFLKFRLRDLIGTPPDLIPEAFKNLLAEQSEQSVETYVHSLYEGTSLADVSKRLELLDSSPKDLEELDDPMINLAAALEKEMKLLREERKSLDQEHLEQKKIYLEALLEKNSGRLAPDANSTIRFTYGFMKGYRPRDAVFYSHQTSLNGVIEKETGEFPFHVPDKLKELHRAKDYGRFSDPRLDDIPACFLNTTSVTGGNSGSPTLNAYGEQIGIIFDMTYESVTGDYYIVPELQRTISVDIRFVLFITEKFSGATHLLKEIGI